MIAAILFAWLQYAADGLPHARAVVTGACPIATFDGRPVRMGRRAVPQNGFGDSVCDLTVPPGTRRIKVGSHRLPAPVREVHKVVVIGDTGCRILPPKLQACNDPAQWPFPAVARSIVREHPDVVVDVGDYYYREAACPATFSGCAGSPSGDNAASWYADWLTPASAMFPTIPLVLARGNHEDCQRGGIGWMRYLDAFPMAGCRTVEAPFAVSLGGLRIAVFDSAYADDTAKDASLAEFERSFSAVRRLVSGRTWFVTHRPPYLNADESAAMGDALDAFSAVLAGHIHLFAVMNKPPHPPLVINGVGGDFLDTEAAGELRMLLGPDGRSVKVSFGFVVYTRSPLGWDISLRDPAGAELAHCVLTEGRPGSVRC